MLTGKENIKNNEAQTKIIGILQPSYLPWIGFIEQIIKSDVFILYDDVQFEKGSWRNRNRIKTIQGIQWVTVPVLTKGSGFQLIKDVKINNNIKWQNKHIKSIIQNYSKSPFFDDFSDQLFFIINRYHKYLLDLNWELINWIIDKLNINTPIYFSSSFDIDGERNNRLIKIIKHLDGTQFYEGASGKNYIDINEFYMNGIQICFQNYIHPVYRQLYGPFISHLSIIDLLFNCGPDSRSIIINN